ncbi:MAG: glycosyltransferase family 87 protein, partial [Acidimicrobiia bacterium]
MILTPIVGTVSGFGGIGAAVWTVRVLSVVVGGANTYLVSRLGSRWIGRTGGVLAAALYATTATVVHVEAAVLQEGFVNLAVLLAAWLLVGTAAPTSRARLGAGLLVGVAIAVKIVAGFFLIPVLVIGAYRRPLRERIAIIAVAAVPLVVSSTGFGALAGWTAVWRQMVVAQLNRPPDGMGLSRVASMLPNLHDAIALVGGEQLGLAWVAVGLFGVMCAAALLGGGHPGRFWGLTGGIGVAVLLASPSYYEHYGVMLAPSVSLVIAWCAVRLGSGVIATSSNARRRGAVVAAVAVSLVAVVLASDTVVGLSPVKSDAMVEMVKRGVTQGECVFAVRVQWLIAANREPTTTVDGHRLLDIYGIELLAGADAPIRPRTMTAARNLRSVQQTIRSHSRACRYSLLVDRRCQGRDRDMTAATQRSIVRASKLVSRTKCASLYRRTAPVSPVG